MDSMAVSPDKPETQRIGQYGKNDSTKHGADKKWKKSVVMILKFTWKMSPKSKSSHLRPIKLITLVAHMPKNFDPQGSGGNSHWDKSPGTVDIDSHQSCNAIQTKNECRQ